MLGALFAISMFSNSGALSVRNYLNWFVWLHPEHYIPSRYLAMTMGPTPWFYPAVTIFSVLVTAGVILHVLGAKSLVRVCAAYVGLYGISILLQFVFVEKYPILKLVILIAPARFTAFGWLMVMVSGTLVFTQIANSLKKFSSNRESKEVIEPSNELSALRSTRNFWVTQIVLTVCVTAISVGAVTHLKEPSSHLDSSKKALLLWIKQNTDITDEIAAPDFLTVEIPLLTLRGTYHGNGFPFNDRCLEENSRRFINLWGSPKSVDWPGYSGHYDALTVSDFFEMSPQVDWVIMKSKSTGAERSASQHKSSYQNQDYVMFQIDN
jgi:hypothetical protein